jgi:nitrate reductase gamma subunit
MAAIVLDCNACKSSRSMKPTKVSRFNTILRLIGYIIVVPSLLGVLGSFVTCFMTNQVVAEALQSNVNNAGAAIGAGLTYGILFFIGVGWLVAGTIGYLLLLKRSVFRCVRCGFILDRA